MNPPFTSPRAWRIAALVLAGSLLLWGVAMWAFARKARETTQSRFTNAVEGTQDRLRGRLDTHLALLAATRAHVVAEGDPHRERFRTFISQLQIDRAYRGIQGIGFAERVLAADVPALERSMSAQFGAPFKVWPESPRDEYTSIVLLEPEDRRNQAALGFDMFTEERRREAMIRARDTGLPAATRKVTLVQEIDPEKQAGFLIYLPLYRPPEPATVEDRRARLVGWVYAPFRVDDLLEGIFGTEHEPRVAFAIYDGDDHAPDALMHRSAGFAESEGRLRVNVPFDVAGETWTLEFRSTPQFEHQAAEHSLPGLLGMGVVASFALAGFSLLQQRARTRAEASERAAEDQRRDLHALLMHAPAAVAIVRPPDFRYELSNPRNVALSSGRAVAGKTVLEAFPELEGLGVKEVLQRVVEKGEPFIAKEARVPLRDRDGRARTAYIDGTYQPLRGRDGRVEGVMAFSYDVTELVEARNQLEGIAEERQKAIRLRDDFLSIAGHELKTPLAALKLQLQGTERQARRGAFGEASKGIEDKLRRAVSHVGRLEVLVNELLDVSRITSGRLSLERAEMDLGELVREVVDRFVEQATRAGAEVRLEIAPDVTGQWDRTRLDQVVTNLVSNALKYGPGKPVEVRVSAEGPVARLEVRDHGIGVAPADRDRIFGRFERAVSDKNYGGLGLGLWISRQIVEAHRGKIGYAPAEGQGSLFFVELPRDSAGGEPSGDARP